ncbi:MAG: ABC transporter permease [Bacteroidales bacterium]|nr:ABC transporter permease [Bacteroidales bacterium]MDD3010446.1 ABC transporter permease [Bacteroidales bacterium]MDD3961865.1 ABC transporter permease [Bacteroidales bacterium]MDY0285998.1 ABC transporter permease [Bacteroidales bacterium]HPE87219.1 ABC transporter permease [Bacteroidales bacterium]
MLLLKLLKESFIFALNSVIVNKVRTTLSLLGITIGIFSIISVLTVFDSLQTSIKNSFDELGKDVIFVTKWPVVGNPNTPWWKYWNRPQPTQREQREILRRSNAAETAAAYYTFSKNIKFQSKTIENTSIQAVTHQFDQVVFFELQDGRYFTIDEANTGRNVAIVGAKIAENLFDAIDPLGQQIKIGGKKAIVIGVFKQQGNSAMGNSTDEVIMVPMGFGKTISFSRNVNMEIAVKAKEGVSNAMLKDEIAGILRTVRSIKAGEEDSFDINEISVVTNYIDQIFSIISIVGWIIGGFSLLVGGFGIANIMFVSVKERIRQIGIQKAIGAKNYFILSQFLFESVFLSLFGGIFGLLLVFVGVLVARATIDFPIFLSSANVIVAISVSILIGLVAGAIPAYNASRLDPVEAMRSNT